MSWGRKTRDDSVHRQLPNTDRTPARPDLLLRTLKPVSRPFFRAYYDVHVHNPEFVPVRGGALMASNHVGWLDGPLLGQMCPRTVHAMVKLEMFEGRMGRALENMGQIPLNRFGVDPAAVKDAVRLLRDGRVVGIYPEGSRGPGEMQHIKRGVAYLALVTGAPIVPVTVFGTREPGRSIDWVPGRGQRLDLVFGEPIAVTAQPWPRRQEEVLALTRQVHVALVAHLKYAKRLTGRQLPGYASDQEPPEPGRITRGVPAREETP